MQKNEILDYLKELKPDLYANGVVSLGLFGSYAKGQQNDNSDIDIVYESSDEFVAKHEGWSAFTYLNTNLRNKVAEKFNVQVDMFDLNCDAIIKEKVKKEAVYV